MYDETTTNIFLESSSSQGYTIFYDVIQVKDPASIPIGTP